jgi:hypothetical protein
MHEGQEWTSGSKDFDFSEAKVVYRCAEYSHISTRPNAGDVIRRLVTIITGRSLPAGTQTHIPSLRSKGTPDIDFKVLETGIMVNAVPVPEEDARDVSGIAKVKPNPSICDYWLSRMANISGAILRSEISINAPFCIEISIPSTHHLNTCCSIRHACRAGVRRGYGDNFCKIDSSRVRK